MQLLFGDAAKDGWGVRPWKIGKARSKTRPHMVRWVVAGKVFTETFASFALADAFRSDLIRAINWVE